MSELKIGLALSGGGSRAIAFHLGCLRALHERKILEKVRVISAVSGGSVIAALYAYEDKPFEEFEKKVVCTLRKGLAQGIVKHTFLSFETIRIFGTFTTSGLLAFLGFIFTIISSAFVLLGIPIKWLQKASIVLQAPLRRFASRTTAFQCYLESAFFKGISVTDVARAKLRVVVNAAELRTGTAFRFGSVESGSWRFGKVVDAIPLAKAVAASAAYPLLLPAFDDYQKFSRDGVISTHRTIISDGGVYDNLGVSCLLPGRDRGFSTNVSDINFIICCAAGQGLPSGSALPYLWPSRAVASVNAIHQRVHSMTFDLLHRLNRSGEIKGFMLPYLGQQDNVLPLRPPDLVPRGDVIDYPTDFSPMRDEDIRKISLRGEQLTRNLIEAYHPNI